MKTTYVFLAVFILILAGSYFESKYINSQFGYFEEKVDEITAACDNGEDTSAEADELLAWWKKEKHTLHAFIPHNEIREIDGCLVEASNLMDYGDFKLASTRLKKLKDVIVSIPDNYSFNFGNIF